MPVEGGFRPRPLEKRAAFFAGLPGAAGGNGESAGTGNALDIVHGLTQRQRRLNLPDINAYYDMWSHLLSESHGYIPQHLTQTIRQVRLGIGFIFYNHPQFSKDNQWKFQRTLQRWHEFYNGQLVLTHEEGEILRDAAAAINVSYDPGTPEEVEKRTFKFIDIESKPPSSLK